MNSPVLYTQIIYRMAQSDKKFESYAPWVGEYAVRHLVGND